jgi:hypothetical protein
MTKNVLFSIFKTFSKNNFHKIQLNKKFQKRFFTDVNNTDAKFLNYLQTKIKMKGPITVSEYMKEALCNPKWVRFILKE